LSSRAALWRDRLAAPNRRAVAVLLAGALVLAAVPDVQAPPAAAPSSAIELRAEPITGFEIRDPSRRQFGLLEFRGGLVLRSSDRNFGGLSAIRVAADGTHFIALTDKGWWFRGRIVYQGTRPIGIADAEMAPILGADGRPLAARGWYDTESIAEDGGTLYVGLERVHQIVRFNYGKEGLAARGRPIPVPPELRALPSNPGNFAVRRSANFDVTDAALLPGGAVLLLERRFSWTGGLAIRMRRIMLSAIKPGVVVDGEVLFEADLGYEIDNMEGLSVHRNGGGEIVLTLVSDDNFSVLQRTLLLQFTLAEP
jgi:hypothetical protein